MYRFMGFREQAAAIPRVWERRRQPPLAADLVSQEMGAKRGEAGRL